MPQYDGSIRINTEINTKNASSQMIGLANQIQKSADKIASLRSKMDALKDVRIPTQEYKNIESDIAKAEKELQKLIEKQAQMQQEGKDSGSAWDRLNQRIQAAKDYIETARDEMQQLVDTGKAFTLGRDTDQFKNLGQQLQYEENHLAQLNARWSEYSAKQESVSQKFNKMQTSAKKAFKAINEGTKKSNASLSGSLKTMLKYGLGIRSFYVLVNKLRSAIKEGFKNLVQYSSPLNKSISELMSSLTQLKNSIATAFAPIVQTAIPYLLQLIKYVTKAMNAVSQFMAVLGGKSTWTRAVEVQEDYAASLEKTGGAAKKAFKALAGFDKLNVLGKNDDDSAGGINPSEMFEEVPIDTKILDFLQKIKDFLKPIIEYAQKLKDVFMQGFWDGLGDWEYRWESIKDSLKSIKDSLIDIWTDPAVLSAADAWAQSVAYMLGSLVGSMASIGLTIATNLIGGLAKYLEQNKERIKGYLISMFNIWTEINQMFAELFQSIAYVFEAFASEQGQQLTANIIGIFSDAFMGVTELASKAFRDIAQIFIKPFVDNKEAFRTALEGFLGVLAEVTGTIKQGIDDTFDKLNEVYDAHFKPFFDSIAQGLSDLVGQFLEFWNGNVQPILDQWAADFDALWTAHIQPLLDNAAEFLGKITDLLKVVWENYLQPMISWIIANVLPKILPVLQAIWETLKNLVGYIADSISNIITILGGIIDFITGVLSGDWEKAFQGLQDIVGGFADLIKNIIEGSLQFITDLIKQFAETGKAMLTSFLQATSYTVARRINFIKENIVGKFGEIKTAFFNFEKNVMQLWVNMWNGLKEKVQSILGGIKSYIQGIADWMVQKIKSVGNAFSSFGSKAGGIFGGRSTFGSTSYSMQSASSYATNPAFATLYAADIPHLASGSVIRGGDPFIAELGDQPRWQTNIETPLPTMIKAFKQAIAETGGMGGGEYTFIAQLNGKTIFEETARQNQMFKKSTGHSKFA